MVAWHTSTENFEQPPAPGQAWGLTKARDAKDGEAEKIQDLGVCT